MIKPTVGRVVWYHSKISKPTDQPQAAIISYVWSDTCVNLMVITPNGATESQTSVYLYPGDNEAPARPDSMYAEWMPYQHGQAAKAEALEEKLKK